MNIYKLASMAGVSVATVSKVINGKEGVGQETRERILKLIDEYDFRPKISNNTEDIIGLVYRLDSPGVSVSNYIMKVIAGVTDTLYEYGYFVTLIPYDFLPKDKNDLRVFCKKRKISGFVFVNLRENNQEVFTAAELHPVVTVSSRFVGKDIVSVRSQNREGAYQAVKELISLGHRDIVTFIPDLLIPDHRDRLDGYKQALEEAGLPVKNEYIIDYVNFALDLPIVVERLFINSDNPPTAAFICDDFEVMKIKSIFEMYHLEIPRDISVVGFDDYDYAAYFSPPLTTVRQPLEALGAEAAKLIYKMVNNPEEQQQDVILDTQLILRKSTRRLEDQSSKPAGDKENLLIG